MSERLKTHEIPLPSDRLILLDLDKTLVNENYNLTDRAVLGEIERVQDLGWALGFNSDTPLEPLKVWSRQFGLNGPILAENGSVIWIPDRFEVVLSDTESYFGDLKTSFIHDLIKRNIPFFYGDATQFVRNNPQLLEMVERRLVVINAYQRCSLSFFTRSINQHGHLEVDNLLGEETRMLVRKLC